MKLENCDRAHQSRDPHALPVPSLARVSLARGAPSAARSPGRTSLPLSVPTWTPRWRAGEATARQSRESSALGWWSDCDKRPAKALHLLAVRKHLQIEAKFAANHLGRLCVRAPHDCSNSGSTRAAPSGPIEIIRCCP